MSEFGFCAHDVSFRRHCPACEGAPVSTPDEYWMAETQLLSWAAISTISPKKVWAVGTGNHEVAWFINRDDALVYIEFCNAAIAAAKMKERP